MKIKSRYESGFSIMHDPYEIRTYANYYFDKDSLVVLL